ncbi:hypothetical protein [Pseudoscardovia suis]|uniref:hypothetical protein n=1 Tax=Pseudoscardovia suis TaxID=987063 RepID=UPI003F9A4114
MAGFEDWELELGGRREAGGGGKEELSGGSNGGRGGGKLLGRIEPRRVKALKSKRKPGGREIAGLERKRREKKGLNYRLMPVSFLLTVIIKPRHA